VFDIIFSIWLWGAVAAAFAFAVTYYQVRMMANVDGFGKKLSENQWALTFLFSIVLWPIFLSIAIAQILTEK
jgi:hypothetical protein